MLDHMILTVSDIKRSLAFYEAALKPLHIKFFMPYKGTDGHPDLWGFGDGKRAFFWIKQGKPDPAAIIGGSSQKMRRRSMNSTKPPCPLVLRTTFRPAHDWNTTRATTRLMYSAQTDIHSRSSTKANFAQPSPRPQSLIRLLVVTKVMRPALMRRITSEQRLIPEGRGTARLGAIGFRPRSFCHWKYQEGKTRTSDPTTVTAGASMRVTRHLATSTPERAATTVTATTPPVAMSSHAWNNKKRRTR